MVVWTIGHSARTEAQFHTLLLGYQIGQLIDVRRFPSSRRYPQFNRDALASSLEAQGIRYLHLPGLGGRRESRGDSPNSGWREPGFRGYADYMETKTFGEALDRLRALAAERPTAIMCAEADWRSCHRGLISDRLKLDGAEVRHIVDAEHAEPHPYTSPARIIDGRLAYSRSAPEQQDLDL
jgi:uncharacterized protein (DUF488 family)